MKWLNAIGRFLKNVWPVILIGIGLLIAWIKIPTKEKITKIRGTVKNKRSKEDLNEADRIERDLRDLP